MSTEETIEVSVDGEPFVALTNGPTDGPLALFLHGFPDLPSTWTGVMRRFAAHGYRCVAPYLRGYPPSTTAGPFDLDQLARDGSGFLDALSPERPAFVLGHDWGAAVTWSMLEDEAARVAAAVTVSVPHPSVFARAAILSPGQLWRSRYMAALQFRSIDRAGVERLWRRWSPALTPPPDHLDEVARTIERARGAPVEYYRAARRSLFRLQRASARVEVPMLYLHGRNDGCISADTARGQARVMAAPYEHEIIEHAGHFVPLERPDELASSALRFFERHAEPNIRAPLDRRGSE